TEIDTLARHDALPIYDLAEHARAPEAGGVHHRIPLRSEVRDLAELHRVALSGGQTLELDHVALSDPVLLATGDDHAFHEAASSENRGTRGLSEAPIGPYRCGVVNAGPVVGTRAATPARGTARRGVPRR